VLIAVALILFYGIIAIRDSPDEAAVHRYMDPLGEAGCLAGFPLGIPLVFSKWRVA
jgi:hypothetical protein